jgi:hypothetical protein
MIIVHEDLTKEAERIAQRFRRIYGFDSKLINRDLTPAFVGIFNGFWDSSEQLKKLLREYANKKILVITPKDIYANNVSQKDDWLFGYCSGDLTLVSTARMKRFDNKPSVTLEVPEEQYMKRLEALAVHEIGHDVVKAHHFQQASWVNGQTGYELHLGPHCTDNTCVMYEIVDITAPSREEGHMQLGTEKKYDAGLDDVLGRLGPNWFCDKCKSSIEIDGSYK